MLPWACRPSRGMSNSSRAHSEEWGFWWMFASPEGETAICQMGEVLALDSVQRPDEPAVYPANPAHPMHRC
jgi:hypothetical protein